MSDMGNPTPLGFTRYLETTAVGATFSGYLNKAIDSIEATLNPILTALLRRDRFIELTVTAKSLANSSTLPLGTTSPDLAYVETADAQNWHSPTVSPERITPTVAGRYRVELEAFFATNATGVRSVQIGKNGALTNLQRIVVTAADDSVGSLQLATELSMNGTTDYITAHAFQSSGAALAITARLVARYVGPS